MVLCCTLLSTSSTYVMSPLQRTNNRSSNPVLTCIFSCLCCIIQEDRPSVHGDNAVLSPSVRSRRGPDKFAVSSGLASPRPASAIHLCSSGLGCNGNFSSAFKLLEEMHQRGTPPVVTSSAGHWLRNLCKSLNKAFFLTCACS